MDHHAEAVDSPPLELEGHIETDDDAGFSERCLSQLAKSDMARNWRLGPPLIARSEKWGLVWRADFSILDSGPQFRINRIVCWEIADGKIAIEIAIGRDLTPLPVAG